ncbi:hypothetical protein ACHAXT_004313 [Thalassiosira profunda]
MATLSTFTTPMLAGQYCLELNQHDVLCGRGSGPIDRVGNINFRNLVMSRKAEYLAAPSREAKGIIAASIVETIRARGGRFLKKLNPTQAKEAGFKRGVTVYELADEPTVLEKAKQTLRQNRAEFVKQQSDDAGGLPASAEMATMAALATPSPSISSSGRSLAASENIQAAQPIPVGSLNDGSMNPIPLHASGGLDSMHRPHLSANTAQQLNQQLFAASMSGVASPSGVGMPGPSAQMASMMQMGSLPDSNLSMNTAELAAAMGSYQNMSQAMGSTTSVQAFGEMLQDMSGTGGGNNAVPNRALMQQYEELRAQQEKIEMLQQQIQQEGQHNLGPQQVQFQQPIPPVQQPMPQAQPEADVFSELLRQYNATAEQYNTLGDHAVHQPLLYQPQAQHAAQQVNQPESGPPLSQEESLLSAAASYQPQQRRASTQGRQNSAQGLPKTDDGNLTGSMLRRELTDDQRKLLDQFQMMQQQMHQWSSDKRLQQQLAGNDESIVHLDPNLAAGGQPTYQDSGTVLNDSGTTLPAANFRDPTTLLNDYEPAKTQPEDKADDDDNTEEANPPLVFHNHPRRQSRRSTIGRDNRTGKVDNSLSNNNSLKMSGISLEGLDMSTTSIGMPGTSASWGKDSLKGLASKLDSSMLSLMSMSLTDMGPERSLRIQTTEEEGHGNGEGELSIEERIKRRASQQFGINVDGAGSEKKEDADGEVDYKRGNDQPKKGEGGDMPPPPRPQDVTVKKKDVPASRGVDRDDSLKSLKFRDRK